MSSKLRGHKAAGDDALKEGRFAAALEAYGRALRVDREHPRVFYNRGLAYLALRRPADAVSDFGYALNCQPRYPKATLGRARAYAATGRLDDAATLYRKYRGREEILIHSNCFCDVRQEDGTRNGQRAARISPNGALVRPRSERRYIREAPHLDAAAHDELQHVERRRRARAHAEQHAHRHHGDSGAAAARTSFSDVRPPALRTIPDVQRPPTLRTAFGRSTGRPADGPAPHRRRYASSPPRRCRATSSDRPRGAPRGGAALRPQTIHVAPRGGAATRPTRHPGPPRHAPRPARRAAPLRGPAKAGTHYHTLGAPYDAPAAALKKLFRKLALRLHPDKNPGNAKAVERFKAVNAAYEVLSDPARRRDYDLSLQPPSFETGFWGGSY